MTISVLDKDGNPQTLDPPTQTTLAAILAKLSSDPATQTTLAAILAKLIAAPATEAKQDAIVTALGALATAANQSTANTTLATLLTAGTPITGQSLESGGAGALGWLASIRKKIAAFGTAGAPSADVLTVQGIGGGTPQPVQAGGYTAVVFGTMTRPADTTAYAAGDGVTTATSSASAMTVTNAARTAAGSGVLLGGKATKSTTSTTNAQFRGWIYQGAPTAIPNDNAAFTAAVLADYQKLVCTFTVDFAAGIVGFDGVEAPITLDRVNPGFKLASGQDLTVIWEARAAYTPGSAEVFRLALDVAQD